MKNARRVHQKIHRTPEQMASLRADRERYQKQRPTKEQLLAERGLTETVPLGEYIELRSLARALREERERQGVTLAELSRRTGIDQAALSRLESGRHDNPTLSTLCRVAAALGKRIACVLRDETAAPVE
jgi:DNA-binding Xre family transcriptional regulator